MVSPALLPIPFGLAMIYALISRKKHSGYVAAFAGIATLALAFFSTNISSIEWFSAGDVIFNLSFYLDDLSLLLVSVVAGIGIFVFLYSTGYLEEKEDHGRYYFLMGLFATSMIGVVLAGNLFQLFFFWELVGISSYLLIGFWHHKESAVIAARKALLTIIVGDAFFLAGVLLLWYSYGTWDIQTILQSLQYNNITMLAGAGILVGAMSKSAQFPLHDWLPDAMEGPTPVSAFLHSATMVKAGLYVMARFLPLMGVAGLMPWMIGLAVITIVISACMALVENDIKRVLAYSTINQLGFIMFALGLGAITAGMFHLLTHSIFKALLFFSAGVAIHTAGTQDLRKIHIRPKKDFFTISTIIAGLALAGLVPFSGFFSKEAIFEAVHHAHQPILIVFFSIAVLLSALYISRWLAMQFKLNGKHAESPWQMMNVLPVLALGALVSGFFVWWFFSAWDTKMPNYLSWTAILSTILVVAGLWLSYGFVRGKWKLKWLTDSGMTEFFRARFMVNEVYNFLAGSIQFLARVLARIDNELVDRTTRGVGGLVMKFSGLLRKLQSGHAPSYVTAMVLGFVLLALTLGVLR